MVDAPLLSDEDVGFLDHYIPKDVEETDNVLIKNSLTNDVLRSLNTLDSKERAIINLYYGIGKNYSLTLEEIGLRFGLTRERVRQIKERALRRLKNNSRAALLKAYLGQ